MLLGGFVPGHIKVQMCCLCQFFNLVAIKDFHFCTYVFTFSGQGQLQILFWGSPLSEFLEYNSVGETLTTNTDSLQHSITAKLVKHQVGVQFSSLVRKMYILWILQSFYKMALPPASCPLFLVKEPVLSFPVRKNGKLLCYLKNCKDQSQQF